MTCRIVQLVFLANRNIIPPLMYALHSRTPKYSEPSGKLLVGKYLKHKNIVITCEMIFYVGLVKAS